MSAFLTPCVARHAKILWSEPKALFAMALTCYTNITLLPLFRSSCRKTSSCFTRTDGLLGLTGCDSQLGTRKRKEKTKSSASSSVSRSTDSPPPPPLFVPSSFTRTLRSPSFQVSLASSHCLFVRVQVEPFGGSSASSLVGVDSPR